MGQPNTDAREQGPKRAPRSVLYKRQIEQPRESEPGNLSHREAFSIADFCRVYGISRPTFYHEVAVGRLRALKLGNKTIILKRDADAWVAALPELLGWAPTRKTKPPIPQGGTEGL